MSQRAKTETARVQHIELGKTLGIREAAELRERLLAAIEAGPLVLDGSAVERVDSAGLQLLVSLQRSLAARGETLTYRGVSTALADAATVLGVGDACCLTASAGTANAG